MSTLSNEQTLHQGLTLVSEHGHFYATMQEDGNFVAYGSRHFDPGNAFWSSRTNGKGCPPFRLVMQNDGNLVVYDGEKKPTWATDTGGIGKAPFRFVVQEDRNMVIYDATNRPTWASATH